MSQFRGSLQYTDWCRWALAAGEKPGSQKGFGQALETKGYVKDQKARHATFEGIALDIPPPPTEAYDDRA